MHDRDVLLMAKEILFKEADSIKAVARKLNRSFIEAVEVILRCTGRVVVIGMGKSGIIGKKIAATLSSTGTPSFYLHPAEALHGDLGMVMKGDVALILSNSGETKEILEIIPFFKRFDIDIISITGNTHSSLADNSNVVIDVAVEEACPLGLAPTSSTTVMLAIGDALAAVLMEKKGFKPEDFAVYHPGGRLGRRLLLKVYDLMHTGDAIPVVRTGTKMKDAILEMTAKGLGAVVVIDEEGKVAGIFTDGDLRRLVEKDIGDIMNIVIDDIMTKTPKLIGANRLAVEALRMMEEYEITVLPVVNDKVIPVGMIHFHDILKAGIV